MAMIGNSAPLRNPDPDQIPSRPPQQVTMDRAHVPPTEDQALWVVIRNSTDALGFENYATFIEPIMGGRGLRGSRRAENAFNRIDRTVQLAFPDAEPYRLLKVATEVFMMANAGVVIGEDEEDDARRLRR